MTGANVTEGIEHALASKHPIGKRDVVAQFGKRIGHGISFHGRGGDGGRKKTRNDSDVARSKTLASQPQRSDERARLLVDEIVKRDFRQLFAVKDFKRL